jgi:hypothetical protein
MVMYCFVAVMYWFVVVVYWFVVVMYWFVVRILVVYVDQLGNRDNRTE